MKDNDKQYFSDLINDHHVKNIALINLHIDRIDDKIQKNNEAERNRTNDIFIKIGIDISKPLEAQALSQFLRESKKRSDTIKNTALKKAVMVLMNAMFFIFMIGAGTYFIDKKIEIALAPRDQKQEISINKNTPPGGA